MLISLIILFTCLEAPINIIARNFYRKILVLLVLYYINFVNRDNTIGVKKKILEILCCEERITVTIDF